MTHHPPLITVLAPIGAHHTPLCLCASVANRPLLKTQKRLNELNFAPPIGFSVTLEIKEFQAI
jgi:hypothetical protein